MDLNVLRRRRAITSDKLAQACVRLGELHGVDPALLHRVQHPTSSGDVRALYLLEACLAVVEAVTPAAETPAAETPAAETVIETAAETPGDDAPADDETPHVVDDYETPEILFGPGDEIPAVVEPPKPSKPAKRK